jgi:hypothetical protein
MHSAVVYHDARMKFHFSHFFQKPVILNIKKIFHLKNQEIFCQKNANKLQKNTLLTLI